MRRAVGVLWIFLAAGLASMATILVVASSVSESVRRVGAEAITNWVKELSRSIQPMVSTSYTGQNGQTHTVKTHREDDEETFDHLLDRHAEELAAMKAKSPGG